MSHVLLLPAGISDLVQSQCSSQERLNHLPTAPTAEEMRILSRHFSSGEQGGGSGAVSASNPSASGRADADESNGAACCGSGRRSPVTPLMMRPRSRSLSSPVRSPVIDSEVVMMNMLYKERFPKVCRNADERRNRN